MTAVRGSWRRLSSRAVTIRRTGLSQLAELKVIVRVAAFQQVGFSGGQTAETEMAASVSASIASPTTTMPDVGAMASWTSRSS